MLRRRRIICSAVLVAMVGRFELLVPVAQAQQVPIYAMQEAQPTSAQLLQRGVQELEAQKYEEAHSTLQQINLADLSEAEHATLREALPKAENAANQRRAARTEFEKGEAALAASDNAIAVQHYQAAAGNEFADEGTRTKAREQLQLAQATAAPVNNKQLYGQAVQSFRANNLADAKAKFEQLQANRYRAGAFQRSPSDYLKEINRKLAQQQPAPAAVAQNERPADLPEGAVDVTAEATTVQPDGAAAAEPAQPQASPRTLYVRGREQYQKGDWVAARENLAAARDAGYKPRWLEDGPSVILARMDKKEQADAARAGQLAQREQAEAQARADRDARLEQMRQEEEARRAQAQAQAQQEPAPQPTRVALVQNDAPTQPAQPSQTQTDVAPRPTATAAEQALESTSAAQRAQQTQRAAEARDKVEQARQAQTEQNWTRALELYTAAVDLDPNNQQAVAGRREMLTITGRTVTPAQALDERSRLIEAKIQELTWQFEDAITQARDLTAENRFEEARGQLRRAENARNIDPNLFSAERLRGMDSTIATTRGEIDRREADFIRVQTAKDTAAANTRIADIQAQQAQERRRTVADLIDRAQELIAERRYSQALTIVDQILVIDSNNDYARGVRPLIEDRALLDEQRLYRETFDRQVVKQLNAAEEKKIPYDDILRYPANWPDISELRDRSVAEERGVSAEDEAVVAQLERRLPEIRFDGIAFADVIDFLRDVTSANIFVNWQALEGAGIDRNTPVNARLRDVKFSKALDTILSAVGGGITELTYTVDEGVITISTAEDLSTNTVTRVYDIRDLIINIPDFEGPEFSLEDSGGGGGSGGDSGGGSGGNLFGDSGGSGGEDAEEELSREELVEQIVGLIQETVAPESWRDNGGTVGSLRELTGQLIVTQTAENHRALVGLLEQLRETRAIQVTVEARFLSVTRSFLEDIGFDWTVSVPDANGEGFGPISFGTNTGSFTANPITSIAGITLPANDPNIPTNSIDGTYGTFLDDFQVSFLLRATQASIFSTTLTAPRVTLFNGQRAYVVVATQQAYVGDLDPVVGSDVAIQDPEIETFSDGVVLDVQATVSADRKYVTLTLRPTLADGILQTFSFQQLTSIPTPGGDDDDDDDVLVLAETTIQQPVIDITEVRTSVSVPDGGTLLLGGQTLAAEIEREIGVPILSKIPWVKRLFTNRSMAKDERVLLILVKPTIIIQREVENRAFPLLSTRVGGDGNNAAPAIGAPQP